MSIIKYIYMNGEIIKLNRGGNWPDLQEALGPRWEVDEANLSSWGLKQSGLMLTRRLKPGVDYLSVCTDVAVRLRDYEDLQVSFRSYNQPERNRPPEQALAIFVLGAVNEEIKNVLVRGEAAIRDYEQRSKGF
jgi:hypothetical protein